MTLLSCHQALLALPLLLLSTPPCIPQASGIRGDGKQPVFTAWARTGHSEPSLLGARPQMGQVMVLESPRLKESGDFLYLEHPVLRDGSKVGCGGAR